MPDPDSLPNQTHPLNQEMEEAKEFLKNELEKIEALDDVEDADTGVTINGVDYHLAFNDWNARELKKIGFEVYDWQGSPDTINAMFEATPKLGEVLMVLCDIPKESEREFLQSLDAETSEACRIALRGAIRNFFPPNARSGIYRIFEYLKRDMQRIVAKQIREKLNTSESAE